MMNRTWRLWLAVGIAGLPSVGEAHAAPDTSNCGDLEQRIALVREYEICALQAGVSERDLTAYLRNKIGEKTYTVRWKAIPADERAKLKAKLGHTPGDDRKLALVVDPRPSWIN